MSLFLNGLQTQVQLLSAILLLLVLLLTTGTWVHNICVHSTCVHMRASVIHELTSPFLLPVLADHETSPWKNHENTTALRAHQSAWWGCYLENVNLFHIIYICTSANLISQPLPLHKTTPSSPEAGDHAGAHGLPPPHPVPPAPQKDTDAPSSCPPTPPRKLAFTRVVRITVYLHCLTMEMLSIASAKPCSIATHKILLSCSRGLKDWKIIRVMPLDIYQTATLTVILQFPQVFLWASLFWNQ